MKYIKRKFDKHINGPIEKIGQGRDRNVYSIGDYVVKVARNENGRTQNLVWDYMLAELAPKMIDFDPEGEWIVYEKAERLERGDFERLTGLKWKQFHRAVATSIGEWWPREIWCEKMPEEEFYDLLEENDWLREIHSLLGLYQSPVAWDIGKKSSLGKINDKLVVVDLGCFSNVKP